ncbi:hypothetical protein BBJ28_00004020 [Nothophytophthora sp. Chile5]|nr:hypothetical protein BBJ28_00004020 [Nothophytophthora sp. Chile5]
MFLWRSRPEDEIKKAIEAAVTADKEGEYEAAVELYASGIEKMMAQLPQLANEAAQAQMRQKINEYMLRAEYLKDWTAAQRAGKERQQLSTADKKKRTGFSKQHAEHANTILDEVLDHSPGVHWVDIAGLEVAKQILQFFTELDGAASSQEDRILVMGATNLPQELDEAIVRRLEKRIYAREGLIRHLLRSQKFSLSTREMKHIVKATEGYSGSDLKAVCKDAALGPIRELGAKIADVTAEEVRGINASDFQVALTRVRPSVSMVTVESLMAWNEQYGVSAV